MDMNKLGTHNMRNRALLGLGTIMLAGILTGCGSGGGGQEGATEEQMRDPAWIQAQLKEMDKNAIPATPPPDAKKKK